MEEAERVARSRARWEGCERRRDVDTKAVVKMGWKDRRARRLPRIVERMLCVR